MKNFLLFVFSCQFICSIFCNAWARSEPPKLTPQVQRAVYEAQQLIKKGHCLKAEECLNGFIEKNPGSTHYLMEFTLGNALALTGKEKKALVHYETSTMLYPDYAPTWQNMAKIYFDLKQYEQAGDCLLKAYKTKEEEGPSALYDIAVSYIMAGKQKKALLHLEYLALGRAGPPKTKWLETLLKVYMDLNLERKTFEVIAMLLDKHGSDPRWWKILAQLYLNQGDYKEGITNLTVYSYLTSLSQKETVLLGDLNNFIGLPLKAAECYERAVCMENNPALYEKLASAYISAHRPTKARNVLKRALKKNPTAKLWSLLGEVCYKEERYEDAFHAFRQSAGIDSKNGEYPLMMGYCALQLENKDKAILALKDASRFPGQRKVAGELLKQVVSWE